MPIQSQNRDALKKTVWQSRLSTIASMICAQGLLVTAAASIGAEDEPDLYVVNTTGGSVTLTLPAVADALEGRVLWFYKPVAANSMVIDGNGSETIEGAANVTRTAQYALVGIRCVRTSSTTKAWSLVKADGQAGGGRVVAADGALAITEADRTILLAASASGTKAATLTSARDGQRLSITLFARSGGSYTIAASTADGTAGTVTLDAAGEGVDLVRVGSTWYVERLIGTATFA